MYTHIPHVSAVLCCVQCTQPSYIRLWSIIMYTICKQCTHPLMYPYDLMYCITYMMCTRLTVLYTEFDVYNVQNPLVYAYDLMYCITYMMCTIYTSLLFRLTTYCIVYWIWCVQCTKPYCVNVYTYNLMYCITYMMCTI